MDTQNTTPASAEQRLDGDHTASPQPTTGWLGIPQPINPHILAKTKTGNQYLVYVKQGKGGEFYFPTGYTRTEDLDRAFGRDDDQKFGFSIHVPSEDGRVALKIEVPEHSVSHGWYQKDIDQQHITVSWGIPATVNGEIQNAGVPLRWVRRDELRKAALERRLSPALLQCLCLDMML